MSIGVNARTARAAAVGAAGIVGADIGFQLALAAGAPWGRAAWGGAADRLPPVLRLASGLASIVLVGVGLVVLRRGGFTVPAPLPDRWLARTCWVLAVLAGVNTIANLASASELERNLMAPAAGTLAVLCAVLALKDAGGRPSS